MRHKTLLAALPLSIAMLFSVSIGNADKLATYKVVDNSSIPEPLTSEPGDPKRGRDAMINRRQGNCLACHLAPVPEQAFHGEIGPDLAGVGDRMTEGELRLRVVNSKAINPESVMPAFYRTEGLHRVSKNFKDKPILTAQQVEDIIAYLLTLKEQ